MREMSGSQSVCYIEVPPYVPLACTFTIQWKLWTFGTQHFSRLSSFGMSIIRGFTVAKQFYTLRLRLDIIRSSRGKILMDEVQT